jgi:SSS family solute:Na+ symporter
VGLTLLTKQKKSDEELHGLVYSLTPRTIEEDVVWYKRPLGLAIIVGVICVILSILFW